MTWTNDDGLIVKHGKEEGVTNKGGIYNTLGPAQISEIKIDYTDALSATHTCVGGTSGALGLQLPAGARIEAVEVIAETAFTSSGTIGTATFVLGLKRNDRSTEIDHDGLTTTAFVGSVLDAAGERTYVVPGVTGAGALIGTTLANSGYLTVANTQHGSHPFTAGKAVVRVYWYNPQTVG